MAYATLIDPDVVRFDSLMNESDYITPNMAVRAILQRHASEAKGSQYPDLVYGIERVGKHDFHVSFYESETGKTKTFTGKEWI